MGKWNIVRNMAQYDKNAAIRLAFKLLGIDSSVVDGGPGSGNFGHRGRPGKRGGSMKGGGAQYRGGRADIGYFNSRKDWLNGLTGETQAWASKIMKQINQELKQKLRRREIIENNWKQGLITETEKQEALKAGGLDKFDENTTTEEYIMKAGSKEDKGQLLAYVQEARNWEKNRQKLIDENLTDEEKKIYEYVSQNFGNLDAAGKNVFYDMTAKALDLPTSGEEIPDEIHYGAGTKERPPEPEKKGPSYDWMDNADSALVSGAGAYMDQAMGKIPSWGHRYTKEDFAEQNQKFMDELQYGLMSPNGVSYYGVNAIRNLRESMRKRDLTQSYGWLDYKYGEENYNRLSDDEKKDLLEITNRFMNAHSFMPEWKEKVEDLTLQDFERAESIMKHSTPRKKEERQMLQRYLLLQDKMLTGAEPTPKEEIEATKNAAAAAKKQEKAEAKAKKDAIRAEKAAAWQAKHSPEEIEKMRYPKQIANVQRGTPMTTSEADDSNANPDRHIHTREQRGNCQTCVVAYELRRRGYDVEAKPRKGDAEEIQNKIASHGDERVCAWIDPETGEEPERIQPDPEKSWNKKSATKWLDSQVKDGERYTLSVCWRRYGAHIINVERVDGQLTLIDPQSGEKCQGDKITEYLGEVVLNPRTSYDWRPEIMRIDNALPNPEYCDTILLKGRNSK